MNQGNGTVMLCSAWDEYLDKICVPLTVSSYIVVVHCTVNCGNLICIF